MNREQRKEAVQEVYDLAQRIDEIGATKGLTSSRIYPSKMSLFRSAAMRQWELLISEHSSKVYSASYALELSERTEFLNPEVEKSRAIISEAIAEKLPLNVFDLRHMISKDLTYCCQSRLTMGYDEHFWEEVLSVYKAGYIPFGYEGEFPSGAFKIAAMVDFPPPKLKEVRELLNKGERLAAIKKMSQFTGGNLPRAKVEVDRMLKV